MMLLIVWSARTYYSGGGRLRSAFSIHLVRVERDEGDSPRWRDVCEIHPRPRSLVQCLGLVEQHGRESGIPFSYYIRIGDRFGFLSLEAFGNDTTISLPPDAEQATGNPACTCDLRRQSGVGNRVDW